MTIFGHMPRIKSYPVKAIFQIGMAQFDNLFVYMPLPESQLFFSRGDEATVIEILPEEPRADRRRCARRSISPPPIR